MGQSSSCIHGVPDWVGPYEKSEKSAVSDEGKMLYDRLRELIFVSSVTKDYSTLEEFLSSNPDILSSLKNGSSWGSGKEKESHDSKVAKPLQDIKDILTNSLHKESHCKSVNFSTDPKDDKPTNIKPVIIRKNCAVHGGEPKCKVHSTHSTGHPSQATAIPTTSVPRKGVLVRSPRAQGSPAKSVRFPPNVGPPPYEAHQPKHVAIPEKPKSKTPTSSNQLVSENDQKISKVDANAALLEYESLTSHTQKEASEDEAPEIRDDTGSTSSENDDAERRQWLKTLLPSSPEQLIRPSDLLAAVGVQSAKDTINRLEDRAETIVETFGVVLKHLEHGDWSTFCMSTSRLCDDIRKVLRDYKISSETTDPKEIKIRNHVIEALHQLTRHTLSLKEMSGEAQHQVLLPSFRVLGEVLHQLMEFLISKELTVIVECIHNESSNHCVKMALCALAEMGTSGELMAELITQVDGIKSLLNFCQAGKWMQLKSLAIRTLTIMCAHPKAATQLDLIGGLDFIISSLLNKEVEETVQSEAVGLLAQVMKHWSRDNSTIEENIKGRKSQLVKALTELAKKTVSSETFLLCVASMATLSSCSTEASSWLKLHQHEKRLFSSNSKLESYV